MDRNPDQTSSGKLLEKPLSFILVQYLRFNLRTQRTCINREFCSGKQKSSDNPYRIRASEAAFDERE